MRSFVNIFIVRKIMRIVKFSLRGNNYSLFGLNSTFLNMQKKKNKKIVSGCLWAYENETLMALHERTKNKMIKSFCYVH